METWIEDKFGGTRQNDFRVFVKANGDTRVFLKKSSERAMMLMSFNGRYANSLPYSFDKTLRDFSEEFGATKGFGAIPGKVCRLPEVKGMKIPMVGWKSVKSCKSTRLLNGLESFYFVHSYQGIPKDSAHQIATYNYGSKEIIAAVGNGAHIGTQFHPEKSGTAGLALLKRFLTL